MCRICSNEKGDIPIFNNIIQPDIPEEIKQFGGITVSHNTLNRVGTFFPLLLNHHENERQIDTIYI